MCILPQVPRYYTPAQIEDFQAGLNAVNVSDYILIDEVDAVAVDYGYYRSLYNEFEKPVTVLFMGVGFSAAQAYAVEFSKDSYRILHYASSDRVSSSHVDALLFDLLCEAYDSDPDDDFPSLRDLPAIASRLFPTVVATKHNFSEPCRIFPPTPTQRWPRWR